MGLCVCSSPNREVKGECLHHFKGMGGNREWAPNIQGFGLNNQVAGSGIQSRRLWMRWDDLAVNWFKYRLVVMGKAASAKSGGASQ